MHFSNDNNSVKISGLGCRLPQRLMCDKIKENASVSQNAYQLETIHYYRGAELIPLFRQESPDASEDNLPCNSFHLHGRTSVQGFFLNHDNNH